MEWEGSVSHFGLHRLDPWHAGVLSSFPPSTALGVPVLFKEVARDRNSFWTPPKGRCQSLA